MSGNLVAPIFAQQFDHVEIGEAFANECDISDEDPKDILEKLQVLNPSIIMEKSLFLKDPNPWLPCIDRYCHEIIRKYHKICFEISYETALKFVTRTFEFKAKLARNLQSQSFTLIQQFWLNEAICVALLLRYNLKIFIYRKFVPQCPIKMLKTGNFNKMPIMIGQTKDEGALFSSRFITDPNCLQYLDKYFDALSSILLFNKTGNFGEEGDVSQILKVAYILYETAAFFLESKDVSIFLLSSPPKKSN